MYHWWECKMVQTLGKKVWQFLIILNVYLPYDPAITLLGIKKWKLRSTQKVFTIVHSSFTCNSQTLIIIQILFSEWWLHKLWYMVDYSKKKKERKKEMSYWHMQQFEWISMASCLVKKIILKRLYTVWLHLYNTLKWQNLRDAEQISGCHRRGMGVRCKSKDTAPGSYFVVMETVLCLDCGSGYTNLYLG